MPGNMLGGTWQQRKSQTRGRSCARTPKCSSYGKQVCWVSREAVTGSAVKLGGRLGSKKPLAATV